jgi:hypothetical protein
MTLRKVGIGLIVAAYGLLLLTAFAAPHGTGHSHHLDPAFTAQYSGPWPVAMSAAVAVAGIALALVPIFRAERWAWCTSLAMLLILLITRITTDPRCLVVLDPHQHGCHTFMIAMVLGVIGLILARK